MTTTMMTLLLQPLPRSCCLSRLAREAEGTTETTSPELQRKTGAKSSNAGPRLWRCRRRRRRRSVALQWAVVAVVVAGQLLLLFLPLVLLLSLPHAVALGDESSSTARPARRAFECAKALALSLLREKKRLKNSKEEKLV